MLKSIYLIFLSSLLFISCESSEQKTSIPKKTTPTVAVPTKPVTEASVSQISDHRFTGIKPGQTISSLSAKIKKGPLKNGEGDFSVYYIASGDGSEIGYFYMDPIDAKLVGDIIITSDDYETAEGIKVGSTYGQIKAKLTDWEVHGSEQESRTTVGYDGYAFLLDFSSNQYNLDKNKVPDTAKVKQIMIRRK